jgi:hypothetical protein
MTIRFCHQSLERATGKAKAPTQPQKAAGTSEVGRSRRERLSGPAGCLGEAALPTVPRAARAWAPVSGLLIGMLGFSIPHGGQCAAAPAPAAACPVIDTVRLAGGGGLVWELERRSQGWTLGLLRLGGKPVDAPLDQGVLLLRSTTGRDQWLPAAEAKQLDARTARLAGHAEIDGVPLQFTLDLKLREDLASAQLTPHWSVEKDLPGLEVCLSAFNTTAAPWRCTLYPFAGNAEAVALPRLVYCGVPAALLFRQDLSTVALFGLDPASDYLNPSTWRGRTGVYFQSGSVAPQFRIGGAKLAKGVYTVPLQLFLSQAGNSAEAISALVRGWVKANRYQVEPLTVRSPQAAFDLFLAGREQSKMWKPGLGYQISYHWDIICPAESPINAYLDYLLYEQTKNPMWRQRAFDGMKLMLRAQHTDPKDPHFGAVETNYELQQDPKRWRQGWKPRDYPLPYTGPNDDPELKSGRFNSADHARCYGFKLDKNGYAARYALLLWERVKANEALDQKDWYRAAVLIADWIGRQQNPDGGLPMNVDYRPGCTNSFSVVSGRTLVAMPVIARITGDKKYAKLAEDLEKFLVSQVEGRYWFTGAHVDLWPKDFESDSVWQAVEYWLDKYQRTQDWRCLRRAEADAWFGFLMWCPKQLSWVNSPTQTCHAEQENYLQYSNYCYQNRKYDCLNRLARFTGDPLFGQLRDRLIQCGCWGQSTAGDALGGQYERLCDPWLKTSKEINSMGAIYVSQLALEANLQLLEMGWVRAGTQKAQ